MQLPPFLLDHWLARYEFVDPPIHYDLAASTGPKFTLRDLQALVGRSFDDVTLGYAPPEGKKELRSAIANYHGVDPDWVVVTTGGSEALSILFCLAAEPGAEVVLPDPQFPSFSSVASAWGLKTTRYTLRRDQRYVQTAAAVLAAVSKNCVLALVNSPHNPTGAVMERTQIEAVASKLGVKGARLVVDEVYHPLYFGTPQPSAANIDDVIVVGDMSKTLSLPGLRTGWLITSDSALRARAIDARSYFTVSGSPLLEALACEALNHRQAIIKNLQEVAVRNVAQFKSFMDRLSGSLGWVPPAGGTVAFPWFKDGRDARPYCEAAASRGVLVAPGDCFQAPSHFRVGFGAQVHGYDRALAILAELLEPK
jgi:aspartate/methionine/tyrosine aminotransferase